MESRRSRPSNIGLSTSECPAITPPQTQVSRRPGGRRLAAYPATLPIHVPLIKFLATGDGMGRGKRPTMRNADVYFDDSQTLACLTSTSTKGDAGLSSMVVTNFDIPPTDSA